MDVTTPFSPLTDTPPPTATLQRATITRKIQKNEYIMQKQNEHIGISSFSFLFLVVSFCCLFSVFCSLFSVFIFRFSVFRFVFSIFCCLFLVSHLFRKYIFYFVGSFSWRYHDNHPFIAPQYYIHMRGLFLLSEFMFLT